MYYVGPDHRHQTHQYFHAKILGTFRIQVLADFGVGDDRLVEAMIWSTIVTGC